MSAEITNVNNITKNNPLVIQGFKVYDLLRLDKYFSPQILLFFYRLSMGGLILSSFLLFLIGLIGVFSDPLNALIVMATGLFGLTLAPLGLRVFFELMAVRFK